MESASGMHIHGPWSHKSLRESESGAISFVRKSTLVAGHFDISVAVP